MGGRNIEEEELERSLVLSSSSSSSITVVILGTVFAVSGSYVFGCAVGYSSPTQPGIMKDLGLSLAQYSVFGSILTIGAMIGAIVSGIVADKLGRRGAMWVSDIFCTVGWLAIFFAKRAALLYIGRLSLGCGIGLLSYVVFWEGEYIVNPFTPMVVQVPVFIAEITPRNIRGAFTTVTQLMICFGVSLTYLFGTFLSWRTVALIGTIPCLIQFVGLFFIPESPRWLAKVGQEKCFENALQRLRGKNANISEEASEIRDYTATLQHLSEARLLELFQRKYARSLIVGVGLMVLQQFGGVNGIAFYVSSIFDSAGFSSSAGTAAVVAVQIPMTMLGVLLMDRSGRRPLLLVSAFGTCIGCFLAGMSFLLQRNHWLDKVTPTFALIGILIYTGSFSLGMGGVPWVIMSEIFPINTKGAAGSLVTLVSWFGSWIVSYAFNFLMQWSSSGTFFLFSSICCLTVVFVAKLVPETKGRMLEEIQASMNSVTSTKS